MTDPQIHSAWRDFAKKFLAMSFEERAEVYVEKPEEISRVLLEIDLCADEGGRKDDCGELRATMKVLEHAPSREFVSNFCAATPKERKGYSPRAAAKAFQHIAYCREQDCTKLHANLLAQNDLDPQIQLLMTQWTNEAEQSIVAQLERELKEQEENPFGFSKN